MIIIFILFILALGLILSLFFYILKLIFKKNFFYTIIKGVWIVIFSFFFFMFLVDLFTSKMELDENDIYGEYVINTNKCPGKQANWQYEHYKFEIKKDNKMYFHIYNGNKKIIKTIIKKIDIKDYYACPRLNINPNNNDFHILKENPALYREIWSFYYVFESDKFGNMFFTKKKWYLFN